MTNTIPANQPLTDRELQVQNARSQVTRSQPVSLGQGVINYINSAFTAAQERPFTTLLSMGAAFFVKATISTHLAGALMITGGLPALGVAVAAAMATSVVFGMVGNLFSKNPKSIGQLVSRMAGSGLIAGLFGGILGGYMDVAQAPEVPPHELAGWEGPDFESGKYAEMMADIDDPDLKAAIQEGYGPVAKGGFISGPLEDGQTSDFIYEYGQDVDPLSGESSPYQYIIEADDIALFDFGEECKDVVNLNSLLSANPDAEWFVIEDIGAVGSETHDVYHRAQLMALVEGVEHQADAMGLASAPSVAIQYGNLTEATTNIQEGPSSAGELLDRSGKVHDVDSQIILTSAALHGDASITESLITRELPAIKWMETNPLGVLLQTPMETELLSDNYAFQAGAGENYEGLLRTYVAQAQETGAPFDAVGGEPTISERITNLMDHAATNHFSDQHFETLRDQLEHTQTKMAEYQELYEMGQAENTPANYEDNLNKFQEIIASQEEHMKSLKQNKLDFGDALLKVQADISADDKLDGKLNILKMWHDAQDRAAGVDVDGHAAPDQNAPAQASAAEKPAKGGWIERHLNRVTQSAVSGGRGATLT
jgi:hypothetical protein